MTVSNVAITLDIDWAPDHVIDRIAERLVAAGVRATWFVTHASPAVDRLRVHPALFELGIHPNFLAGSTHGDSLGEVLQHCMTLVPEARSMRTHSLVQSTVLLEAVASQTPIEHDVSLYLPGHGGLKPFAQPLRARPITRLPFWWEDDFEMYGARSDWALARRAASAGAGLCILNFHPIHIALNSPSLERYEALKTTAPRLRDASAAQVAAHRLASGVGAGTAFNDVVTWLSAHGGGRTITQLARAA
jgi:hypothetical protein